MVRRLGLFRFASVRPTEKADRRWMVLDLGDLGCPGRLGVLRLGQLAFGPGSETMGLGSAELD